MNKRSKLALKLAAVSVAMFGFGFVLVPLYDILCEVTGLNGKTGAISATDAALNSAAADSQPPRPVVIELIAHADPAVHWEFKPEQHEVHIKTGEIRTINYLAKNNTEHDMTVQAAPSVVPARAAAYLKKIECFCFEQQFLAAGEELTMPARIVVDSDLPPQFNRITLNYTLFKVDNEHS